MPYNDVLAIIVSCTENSKFSSYTKLFLIFKMKFINLRLYFRSKHIPTRIKVMHFLCLQIFRSAIATDRKLLPPPTLQDIKIPIRRLKKKYVSDDRRFVYFTVKKSFASC